MNQTQAKPKFTIRTQPRTLPSDKQPQTKPNLKRKNQDEWNNKTVKPKLNNQSFHSKTCHEPLVKVQLKNGSYL